MGVKKTRRSGLRAGTNCETLESRTYFAITLGAAGDYPGVTSPHGIVTADFNNDGSPDVAVAGIDPNTGKPTVAVYLDGETPPTYYDLPAGQLAFDLVAADFDGVNGTDIAVSDPVNGTVSVLLNNGDGTFGAPIITSFGTPQPASSSPVAYLAEGDFNGDTKPDLAVTDPGDHEIVILLGNGDGTFSIEGTTVPEPSFDPEHIVAATFTSSGDIDLAYNDGTVPDIYVALGNGNGTFATPTPYSVNGAVQGISAGDLTEEGTTDLAVSTINGSSGSVDELLNTGSGFAAATTLATTFPDPGPIVIADINGDGVADVVTLSPSTGSLDLFLGDGNGVLSAAAPSQVTSGMAQDIITADVNGDGKSDLLFSEVNTSVSGDGGFGLVFGAGVPDFSASVSGTVPATAVEGQKLKLTQTVDLTNVSGAVVSGSNDISLALSPSPDFTTNAYVLNSVARSFRLPAGKVHAVKVSGNLPVTVPPGTYYLIAEVTDSNGGIANAVASQSVTIDAPVIEFSGSFKTDLTTGKAGKILNESIIITNSGNVSVAGKLPVVVDVSTSDQLDDAVGTPVSLTKLINIKPGKSVTMRLTRLLAPVTAGTYYVIVQLDPNNKLNETNTANNTFVSMAIVVS